MKKINFKGVVSGLIMGIVLTASFTSLAQTKTLTAYLSDIKVLINGKQLESDVPPVIVDGRTLLPARAIAEALGKDVGWDAETGTVTINDKVVETPKVVESVVESEVNAPQNIVEWKYEGFEHAEPYREYERKYVDGVFTSETRYTGKNHDVKFVTLYANDGRKIENVPEYKIDFYGEGWYLENPNVEIEDEGFITEGTSTHYVVDFTDGFVVAVSTEVFDVSYSKTAIVLRVRGIDKSKMNVPTIIAYNELFEKRYFPRPMGSEYEHLDFFESYNVAESSVSEDFLSGGILYETPFDIDYITYDDGIHKCTLYLK